MWSGGGRCPICSFGFQAETDSEEELDAIAAVVVQTHSDIAHDGAQVTVQVTEMPQGVGERPRLVN